VELDAAAIAKHVHEALGSPLFVKAERQARFLRFVVDAALQSPAPLVREFDIARAVYDRRDDYDPCVDPIVRVEAARLRARLREYYEVAPPAHVRIDLPKGRYLPQFMFLASSLASSRIPPGASSGGRPRGAETTVLVQPFRPLGAPDDDAGFTEGLAEELMHALTRLPNVRGRMPPPSDGGEPPIARPDVRLEATVRRVGAAVRVTLRLVDPIDGVTTMSNLYAMTVTDEFAAQEQLARRMCEDVAAALSPMRSSDEGGMT
jgi:TolB-like protein